MEGMGTEETVNGLGRPARLGSTRVQLHPGFAIFIDGDGGGVVMLMMVGWVASVVR